MSFERLRPQDTNIQICAVCGLDFYEHKDGKCPAGYELNYGASNPWVQWVKRHRKKALDRLLIWDSERSRQ